MKKKRLGLKDLKVSSFVTSLDSKSEEDTVKGGGLSRIGCWTKPFICQVTVTCPPAPPVFKSAFNC